jgi:hypothetical protein
MSKIKEQIEGIHEKPVEDAMFRPAEGEGGPQLSERKREVSTKELLDYAFDGAYHEAGHAIVRAYLRMPFVSVTVQMVEGVHAGFTDVVPRRTTTQRDFIDLATFSAAGRLATDIYTELNPGMTRFHDSDREDQKAIGAQAQQMRTNLGVDPEQWKAGIVARTDAILRIPYVWEAVEEVARQLIDSGGEYAIPARQVRRILRQAKEEGAMTRPKLQRRNDQTGGFPVLSHQEDLGPN